MNAIRRSFQTQRNWKIPYAASAGTESGMDDLKEDPQVRGSVDPGRLDQVAWQGDEEVTQQEDPSGRPNAVWASQIPPKPLAIPSSRKRVSSGTSAICTGTIISATSDQEDRVAKREGDHEKP